MAATRSWTTQAGDTKQAEKTTAVPRAEMERLDRIRAGRKARRLPHLVTLGTAAAGCAAWGVAEAAELLDAPGYAVPSVTALAAAGTIAAARVALRSSIPERWRCRYWLAGAAAGLWTTVTSAYGLSASGGAALVVAEAALAAGWWRAHRSTRMEPTAEIAADAEEAAPAPTDDAMLRRIIELWDDHIRCSDGPLPGAYLFGGKPTESGYEFIVQLKPAKGALTEALGKLDRIAAGLRSNTRQVILDAKPVGEDENEDISQIRLQVVTKSPIRRTVYFTPPKREKTGRVAVGPFADGRGKAELAIFTENSMWSMFVMGSTGFGKSSLITGLVVKIRAQQPTVTFYVDPMRGSSAPALAKNATLPVLDEEQFEDFTAAVESIVDARAGQNSYYGLEGYNYTAHDAERCSCCLRRVGKQDVPHDTELCLHCRAGEECDGEGSIWQAVDGEWYDSRPAILIVIDECDMFWRHTKNMGARWGLIAKVERKLGMGIIPATQGGSQDLFGGSELLRSSLVAGSVCLLRTESNSAPSLIAKGMPNPRTLPEDPGFLYVRSRGTRMAPARSEYLPGADKNPDRYNDVQALADFPDAPLDRVSRNAAGDFLLHKDEVQQRNRETMAAKLQALMAGSVGKAKGRKVQETGSDSAIETGAVPSVPSGLRLVPPPPRAGLSEGEASVVALIAAGTTKTGDLQKAAGYSESGLRKLTTRLREQGVIADAGHGRWALTDHGRELAGADERRAS